MRVVILAGGLGTRLAEETDRIPKPMVTIGSRPILWHIMKIYSHYGLNDFIICAGYKGHAIVEYFVNYRRHTADVTVDLAADSITYLTSAPEPWRVTVIDTGATTETGGRLRRIREHLRAGETFCMTYGDGVSDIDIDASLRFHRANGFQATLTAVRPPARFGEVTIENGRGRRFVEKPLMGEGHINGGFFVLEPAVLDLIESDRTVWEHEPLQTLAERGQLGAYVHDGFWQPMDALRDRRLLEQLWASGKAPWKLWKE